MRLTAQFCATLVAAALFLGAMPAAGRDAPVVQPEVLPIALRNGNLEGAGGDRLRSELRNAQFVAIGEDHGFSGPPEFASALAREMALQSRAPVYLAVEVGEYGAAWARAKLKRGGVAGLQAGLKGQPFALPFLSNVEDARLAEPFARQDRLWGIDQEFVGTAAQIFDDLASRCSDANVAEKLRAWASTDRAGLLAGEFGKAALSALPPDEIRSAGNACGGESRAIMADVASSARIYQYNNSAEYARNNEERASYMAARFMASYKAVSGKKPRVVLKMGAYHLGRGTTPTSIYDLGSYLPPLAAQNGLKSLHVAWVPIGGRVRTISPGNDHFTSVGNYQDEGIADLLTATGIAPERIGEGDLVLIPLQPLRYRIKGKQLRALPDLARFVLLGFDYLVTTRSAVPATHFEAWDGR